MKDKVINIGGSLYTINSSLPALESILHEIIVWMGKPENYDAYSGADMLESDSIIDSAPILLAKIVDDILKPKLFIQKND